MGDKKEEGMENGGGAPGDDLEDEEIIVYVAPHLRAGPVTPSSGRASCPTALTTSVLTGLQMRSVPLQPEFNAPTQETSQPLSRGAYECQPHHPCGPYNFHVN